jgi:hypothetical protein
MQMTPSWLRRSQQELFFLKALLQTYSQSTGLKVNFGKSCLLPINMSQEKAELLAGVFGCSVGRGELRNRYVSRGPGPRLLAEVSSGTATCPSALNLASLLR